jgi:hypothetical protein
MRDTQEVKRTPVTLEYLRPREAILADYKNTQHLMKCSDCWTLTTVDKVIDGSEPHTSLILCPICALNRKLKTL